MTSNFEVNSNDIVCKKRTFWDGPCLVNCTKVKVKKQRKLFVKKGNIVKYRDINTMQTK